MPNEFDLRRRCGKANNVSVTLPKPDRTGFGKQDLTTNSRIFRDISARLGSGLRRGLVKGAGMLGLTSGQNPRNGARISPLMKRISHFAALFTNSCEPTA